MSITLLCSDGEHIVVQHDWIDRWELLSNIRDEMGVDSNIVVPYTSVQLQSWITMNKHITMIEDMTELCSVGRSMCSKDTFLVKLDDGYISPPIDMCRFFLPKETNLLMRVDRKDKVEIRVKHYETVGREVRRIGLSWPYILNPLKSNRLHKNLEVSQDIMFKDWFLLIAPPQLIESVLNEQHLNLFVGIIHDAYISSTEEERNDVILPWYTIDWEALISGCVKYRRTPKWESDAKSRFQLLNRVIISTEYDENMIGFYTVLAGGKSDRKLPSLPYHISKLAVDQRPFELLNLIYSGYSFEKDNIESLGLDRIIGVHDEFYVSELNELLRDLNHKAIKECQRTNCSPVEYAYTLGLYFGTTALAVFRDVVKRYIINVPSSDFGGLCRERCQKFISTCDKYLLTHQNELPTKIPGYNL